MNEAKKKYQKSCKSKVITFYKHEGELLDFANEINFQKFVKQALYNAMVYDYKESIKKRFKKGVK